MKEHIQQITTAQGSRFGHITRDEGGHLFQSGQAHQGIAVQAYLDHAQQQEVAHG